MTSEPVSRAARAAIFAAVCVLTAALGHALASGAPLPWLSLGSAFAGTASVAWWIAGRERGAVVVTGSAVVTQLGLHSLFGLLRPAPAPAPALTGAEHAELMRHMSHEQLAEHMAGMESGSTGMGSTGMGSTGMGSTGMGSTGMGSTGMGSMDMSAVGMMLPGGHSSALMFAAHSLAALVCGLWLWRGEAAAFRLARSLAAVLFVPLWRALRITGAPAGPPPPSRPVPAGPARVLRAALLQHVVSRRGPPGYVALG
ncbi:hypothetical protein [Streptomyces dysideae]|uniref:PE-PGRS family protein n=1 Tax=Streptomyces dysideae TaxID=909626 RepID=A0A117RYX1_9ACTN|nr:hypothetical protein [Streptomyces dysideae]KUO17287.1 hypothetical protein AQJ91_30955 [Streptomyces dysideae]